MKPIIELHHISKKYKIGERKKYESLRDSITSLFQFKNKSKNEEFWALKDISFSANPGDVIGIIGKNGAGKSTLLKVLSKITPPTTGKAILRGRVASLLEVGTGFHPELTGAENIYLNGAILGMKRWEIKKKFDEIVDFAEVEKFLDTPVKHYSSGMYMRLAFAVAAHLDAEILLVDEVLAVGDAAFQKKCLGKIKTISKYGRSILYVSHNLGSILSLCNKVFVLENGKKLLFDEPQKAVDKYVSSYTSSSINPTSHSQQKLNNKNDHLIRKVSLKNSKGKYTNSFLINEDFKFEIEYTIKSIYKSISFWILFNTESEVAVVNSFQKDQRKLIENPNLGNHIVEAYFSAPGLLPGAYTISVGILEHSISNEIKLLEWIDDAQTIQIIEKFIDRSAFDKRWGLVTINAKWKELK